LASVLSHPAVPLGLSPHFGLPRSAIAAGVVLSVLPDVDSLGLHLGIPYGAPLGHRGLTHSIAFATLSAAAGLGLLRAASRREGRVAAVFGYLFLCAVSHGLLDGMTDGGLGVAYFAPFSNARYFLPWRPIRVSPLSISGFFSARGVHILQSELVWIWAPSALLAAAAWLRAPASGSRQSICRGQRDPGT